MAKKARRRTPVRYSKRHKSPEGTFEGENAAQENRTTDEANRGLIAAKGVEARYWPWSSTLV